MPVKHANRLAKKFAHVSGRRHAFRLSIDAESLTVAHDTHKRVIAVQLLCGSSFDDSCLTVEALAPVVLCAQLIFTRGRVVAHDSLKRLRDCIRLIVNVTNRTIEAKIVHRAAVIQPRETLHAVCLVHVEFLIVDAQCFKSLIRAVHVKPNIIHCLALTHRCSLSPG